VQSSEQLFSDLNTVVRERLGVRDWPTGLRSFIIQAGETLKERRFFLTPLNRMGLAPEEAREGDYIPLILGNQVPYMLRSLKRGNYSFTLIGECYVDGFMNG
jgi:hypothetical protein